MFEKGQRVVIRGEKEEMVLVEDIITSEDGQLLKVKNPSTGLTRVVNPVEEKKLGHTIVEHLED